MTDIACCLFRLVMILVYQMLISMSALRFHTDNGVAALPVRLHRFDVGTQHIPRQREKLTYTNGVKSTSWKRKSTNDQRSGVSTVLYSMMSLLLFCFVHFRDITFAGEPLHMHDTY